MYRPIASMALTITLAVFPSTAAAKTFRGKTSQSRSASLTTGADGVPKSVRLRWSAPCKHTGLRASGGTGWTPPFTAATADSLNDGPKTYRTKLLSDGSRGRVTTTLTATRKGGRWIGTLALREVFSRKGKVIDVCQIKRIRFTVS